MHKNKRLVYAQVIDDVRTLGYIITDAMEFDYEPKKNERLYNTRGVTFPMVIEAIAERGVLLNFPHPNQQKYPGQKAFVVNIGGYTYCVPYVEEGNTWFLKTIYASRKSKYLIEGNKNE